MTILQFFLLFCISTNESIIFQPINTLNQSLKNRNSVYDLSLGEGGKIDSLYYC